MSTRHGAPGGLGRGLSALIRTSPRPEEAERSVTVMDPVAVESATRGVILDSSVTPDGGRSIEPLSAPAPSSSEGQRTEPTEPVGGGPGANFAELEASGDPRQPAPAETSVRR